MLTRWSFCSGVIAIAAMFAGISPARAADDSAALKDRLHAAEKDTSLNSDDIAPFYLKMSVQLFDAKGKPSEQGTVELYWAGDDSQKRVYSFASYAATEVVKNGTRFRTPGTAYPPEMVGLALQQVLHPMAQDSVIDKSQPEIETINLSKMPLDCILMAGPGSTASNPPLGIVPTYCIAADGGLRITFDGPRVILRNSISVFQQRHVAFDAAITVRKIQAVEEKILTLEQRPIAEADLSPDGLRVVADWTPLDGPGSAGPVRVSAELMAGLLLNAVAPAYPPGAKAMHVQGTVVLHAQIGRDGHIHDLQVVSSPDTELSGAAMDAVRQWTYRPYILSGTPAAVDTTINVNFMFGGR